MVRTKQQQDLNGVVGNITPVSPIGNQVTTHSESSAVNRAAEKGQGKGVDLP